jgi:hypothetical protein
MWLIPLMRPMAARRTGRLPTHDTGNLNNKSTNFHQISAGSNDCRDEAVLNGCLLAHHAPPSAQRPYDN